MRRIKRNWQGEAEAYPRFHFLKRACLDGLYKREEICSGLKEQLA